MNVDINGAVDKHDTSNETPRTRQQCACIDKCQQRAALKTNEILPSIHAVYIAPDDQQVDYFFDS